MHQNEYPWRKGFTVCQFVDLTTLFHVYLIHAQFCLIRNSEHTGLENRWSLVCQGLMIVNVTGFIPLSLLPNFLMMVMWESSQRLETSIVQSPGKKNSRKAWIGIHTVLAAEI